MDTAKIYIRSIGVIVGFALLTVGCQPPKTAYSNMPKIISSSSLMATIAGNGIQGYSGDGGAANQATLSSPSGIAIDFTGTIYISDKANNRIRKVTAGSNIISTLAGTGTVGYSGDGAAAIIATLNNPTGVAVDAFGNVYIADAGNNCIRKVVANTGTISTIAGTGIAGFSGDGGIATVAQLHNPSGIAVDLSGNVFIADLLNNRIRKITASTQLITTVAGGGICPSGSFCGDGGAATAATLHAPMGIAIDASGNMYIADTDNNRVRMVTKETGIINTLIGNGLVGFFGDGGQATAAQLHNPYGVAVDGYGNIYVADNVNNRIRQVAAGVMIITTIAGNGIGSYAGDGGVATVAELQNPYGVAIDGSGNIFVADYNNQRIRRFN
ncbi:MAG: NHL repeat-containing protein [Bacteroidia bacterium]